jgi:hypothetical protein
MWTFDNKKGDTDDSGKKVVPDVTRRTLVGIAREV